MAAPTPPRAPAASWLHPSVEARSSMIEGTGLFVTDTVVPGEVLIRLGGDVIDDERLARLTPPYSSVTLDEGWHLLLDPSHPVRFGNHSCDPSLWHTDATTLVARRPISAGAELTIDYATHTGVEAWSMDCNCGTPSCRRRIQGSDWRLKKLQVEYGAHWSPILLQWIRSLSAER